MTNARTDRGYLSLLVRPDQLTGFEVAQALGKVLATDPYTLEMQCKGVPPNVIASLPVAEAERAAELLRHLGCSAFVPTLSELMALGASLQIKFIRLKSHGIEIETWRDGIHILQPQDIDVIVSAKIKEEVKKSTLSGSGSSMFISGAALGEGLGRIASNWSETKPREIFDPVQDLKDAPFSAPSHSKTQLTCKLDLHMARGSDQRVFQVNADKFGFDILGREKGLADSVNVDRLRDYFAALAPRAAVDRYFDFFKAPPDHHRLRIPRRQINKDHPGFAFYSRWVALMYRYLARLP